MKMTILAAVGLAAGARFTVERYVKNQRRGF